MNKSSKRFIKWLIYILCIIVVLFIIPVFFVHMYKSVELSEIWGIVHWLKIFSLGEKGDTKNISIAVSIVDILTLIGGAGTAYLFYQKLKQKDEQYTESTQFQNFHTAAQMLTDRKSTVEAKISALFLLYDIAKKHLDNLSRVIQVINKQLIPIIQEADKGACIATRQTITEWQYKGSYREKLMFTALYILRKIARKVLPLAKEHTDLSYAVFFDVEGDLSKSFLPLDKDETIENLIFLHCTLKNTDFSKMNLYRCSFIHCTFENCDFSESNLWGTMFYKCEFKCLESSKSKKECEYNCLKFNKAKGEGVEFVPRKEEEYGKIAKIITQMKFEEENDYKEYLNKNSKKYLMEKDFNLSKKNFDTIIEELNSNFYPVIISENNLRYQLDKKNNIVCFEDNASYDAWKNSDQ